MAAAVMLCERSGNWLYLADSQVFALSSPEMLVDGEGIELWVVRGEAGSERALAAVRFPTGWTSGHCWTWAIRNLAEEIGALPLLAHRDPLDETVGGYEWLNLGLDGSALVAHRGSVSELLVHRRPRMQNGSENRKRPGSISQAA